MAKANERSLVYSAWCGMYHTQMKRMSTFVTIAK